MEHTLHLPTTWTKVWFPGWLRRAASVSEHEWEAEADNWSRWAGVSRDLARRGHDVMAIDISPTLLHHARSSGTAAALTRADAGALPFASATFDLVVACNSLQVVGDMAGAVTEAGRVLSAGDAFAICVTHPAADVRRFLTEEPDSPFVLRDDYFANRWVDDTVERDGLTMRFTGWTHSLEEYALALQAAQLHITALRESRPDPASGRDERHQRVPMFLFVLAVEQPGSAQPSGT